MFGYKIQHYHVVKLVSNKIYREVVVRGGVPYHLGLHLPWLTPMDTMDAALCLIQSILMAREFRGKKIEDCANTREPVNIWKRKQKRIARRSTTEQ